MPVTLKSKPNKFIVLPIACAGSYSLFTNTTGNHNTAAGNESLTSNTIGTNNTANGYFSLKRNNSGSYNTANGSSSLENNTTGNYNTANGYVALQAITTGSDNTAEGAYAGVNINSLNNTTALGHAAIATSDNQVMLGNTSVTSVKAAGSFVIYSDGRFKKNLKENIPGLKFINLLKPVTYNYDINALNAHINGSSYKDDRQHFSPEVTQISKEAISNKEKIKYSGFIAQDVEAAAKKIGYDFSGIYKPANETDSYGLAYAEFVIPLVKAVQELSKKNDEKDEIIDDLKTRLTKLEAIVNGSHAQLSSSSDASLEQNTPNPFSNTTTIHYTLPLSRQGGTTAQIIITDKNGKAIKQATVSGNGKGKIDLNTVLLASGIYQYTLIIGGKIIDSKQMILAK